MSEVQLADLVEDLRNSVTHLEPMVSKITIEDMQNSFLFSRQHLIMLCDAFLSARLTSEALNTIAFALMASDHFEWNDETMSEVISDWSAPEINFPLTEETIKMHRNGLTDTAMPLPRQVNNQVSPNNRLISVRKKVRPN